MNVDSIDGDVPRLAGRVTTLAAPTLPLRFARFAAGFETSELPGPVSLLTGLELRLRRELFFCFSGEGSSGSPACPQGQPSGLRTTSTFEHDPLAKP